MSAKKYPAQVTAIRAILLVSFILKLFLKPENPRKPHRNRSIAAHMIPCTAGPGRYVSCSLK